MMSEADPLDILESGVFEKYEKENNFNRKIPSPSKSSKIVS